MQYTGSWPKDVGLPFYTTPSISPYVDSSISEPEDFSWNPPLIPRVYDRTDAEICSKDFAALAALKQSPLRELAVTSKSPRTGWSWKTRGALHISTMTCNDLVPMRPSAARFPLPDKIDVLVANVCQLNIDPDAPSTSQPYVCLSQLKWELFVGLTINSQVTKCLLLII